MRASYSHHYRRVIPALLQGLEFRSNNQIHQPVIRALDVIKRTVERDPGFQYFPLSLDSSETASV
jgi:hypothetical protein